VTFRGDEVTYVSLGDGTTSEGEFWEALNAVALNKLPVIFCVQDNGYAISVPVEVQTAGGSISRLVSGFPNFHFEEVDGTDPVASYGAFQRATQYCREGHGPAFVHAHVIRPYSHSLSDDERLYRPDTERERDSARDPVSRTQMFLLREGILDEKASTIWKRKLRKNFKCRRSGPRSSAARTRERDAVCVFAGYRSDIGGVRHAGGDRPRFRRRQEAGREDHGRSNQRDAARRDEARRTHRDLRRRRRGLQPRRISEAQAGEREGRSLQADLRLQNEFGNDRVFNSPLAEAAIVGRATGMATRGIKPVVEIQFFDYIWPAMMQIRDELSVIRWRSNNVFSCPVVIRVAIGGYLTGGAIYHSQCGESAFTHMPGLRVVFPSNALDAAGLLRTAIRCDDPVLFSGAQAALSRDLRARALSRAGVHDSVRQGEDRESGNGL
jgi:2-oxoisovalerate dehydrogenase E1 component